MNKKKTIILTGSVIALGALGGVSAMIGQSNSPVGADTSPIVTTLDNHETRIKNNENDIAKLQSATGTTPSTSNQSVPVVNSTGTSSQSTSSSTPIEEMPGPVVVTAFREIVIDGENSNCEYTYSDGTKYTFEWKRTNPQGSWVTDSSGNNGHWVPTTSKVGYCDNRALGQTKN